MHKHKISKKKLILSILLIVVVLISTAFLVGRKYIQNIMYALELEDQMLSSDSPENCVDTLEELVKKKLLPDMIKIDIYSSLASYYSISRDYANTIRCSVIAVSMADEKGYPFYAAANYLTMCDVFLMLNDYEIAEKAIQRALSYEIDDISQEHMIREFAYMDLADIHIDNPDKAREYLLRAKDYANIESSDYQYNELDRSLIEARILLQEQCFEEADEIIKTLHTVDSDNFAITYSLDYPLMEIETQLELLTGDSHKALEMVNEMIAHYRSDNTDYLALKFVRSILPIVEERIPEQAEAYQKIFVELYDNVLNTSDKFTSEFIFDTYSKAYNTYQSTIERTILIAVIIIVSIVVIVLSVLFYIYHTKATHDSLTGVYNRGQFNNYYAHLQKARKQYYLIMCDIDYFKRINDNYGHEEGDVVLKKIAKTLTKQLNKKDKLFRVGGEEFCIITNSDHVLNLTEHIRKEIESLNWDKDFQVTMSFGIADSSCTDNVYKAADNQLYYSKEHGRNMVSY